jgi:hypothetical protein
MDTSTFSGEWGSENFFPGREVSGDSDLNLSHTWYSGDFTRWSALRATEGWAALQYHSVLRSSITLLPPHGISVKAPPRLHVQLVQGSFFCVMPVMTSMDIQFEGLMPKWYSGNIYDMEQAPRQIIDLPTPPSPTAPTTYDFFVSGDYEVVGLKHV